MLDINVSEKLLIQFSQFKPTGRKPTWMEICSFPQQRFEEICSRILRFFLNPDNPHGLKDLFIRSFEQCLSEKCLSDVIHEFEKTDENEHVLTRGPNGTLRLYSIPEYERFIERIKSYPDKRKLDTFKRGLNLRLIDCLVDQKQQFLDIDNSFCIQCEVVTEQQNRIDLLISCSSWVACIENKIFANIQNPLDDYEDYVDKLFGKSIPDEKRYFVILSLKEQERKNDKWVYIYYHELFKHIKENLGNYIENADKDYLAFLMDWIKTMEYKTNNMEDCPMGDFSEEEFAFFSNEENAQKIEKLTIRKQQFDAIHTNKFIKIRDSIKANLEESFKGSINAWYWQQILAVDFVNKKDKPFIDIVPRNGKCYIVFALRDRKRYEVSKNYYAEKLERQRDFGGRIVLDVCEIQEDAITKLAKTWIQKILEFEP